MDKDILFVIRDCLDKLSNSEANLANYILEHPEEIIHLSAEQLAKKANSSPATIIRFTKSIGINGYTDLKLRLSSDFGQKQVQIYTDIEKDATSEDIKVKLKARVDYVLDKSLHQLESEVIEACISAVEKAKVIYCFGVGASSLVAQDIYQKFSRLGKIVIFEQDHHNLASMMSSIEDALLICVSNSGKTREPVYLAEVAFNHQLPIIAITSEEDSPLATLASWVLPSTHIGEKSLRVAATVSLMSQFFVVDVFFLSYAARQYDDTIEKLKVSKDSVHPLHED